MDEELDFVKGDQPARDEHAMKVSSSLSENGGVERDCSMCVRNLVKARNNVVKLLEGAEASLHIREEVEAALNDAVELVSRS